MARRRRRLPKGAYPLPEGGYAVNRDGRTVIVGTGEIRVDPELRDHPNLELLARALLALEKELRDKGQLPKRPPHKPQRQ